MSARPIPRTRHLILLSTVLTAALFAVVPRGSGEEPAARARDCYAPATALVENGAALSHTAARLLRGEPVTIVAFGSSSTAGAGASNQAHSYPAQLAQELQQRFPASDIRVINKGINGEQAPQMLARLEHDVLELHPDLVIWQTGSNEILHHGNLGQFRSQTVAGLDRLKAAGIEVILMDAQYTPRIIKNPDYADFNTTLRDVARDDHVPLFDRFKAMQFWLATERRDWSDMVAPDLLHLNDHGYRCIAAQVATLIATDAPAVATR
jgi:lysophospholipase L1-like esterase